MCSVFSAAVAAITPATTSAAAETIATTPKGTGHATGHLGKKHSGKRPYRNNYSGFPETPPPGYYGNWGFAPVGVHCKCLLLTQSGHLSPVLRHLEFAS